jgi:hypothetical protein
MNALVWLKGRWNAIHRGCMDEVPVLRRAEAQAEAGPLMGMVRRENMGLSIAAGRGNRKARRVSALDLRIKASGGAGGPDCR